MKYIIANWKANKNYVETVAWLAQFNNLYKPHPELSIIICPPFPFLTVVAERVKNLHQVTVGVQNISHVEKGSYTGETTVKNIEGLARYAIIGHSEQRRDFGETEEEISQKVSFLTQYDVSTILCMRSTEDRLHLADFITYEPESAISTGPVGKYEPIDQVVAMRIKLGVPAGSKFIYGGSVNEKNVFSYLVEKSIDGVLVGAASLDAERFCKLIDAAV